MTKEKEEKLKIFRESLRKKFGEGSVVVGGDAGVQVYEVIPTGSIDLNEKLTIGGYPRGRFTEIFGPESSGKSTLCLHAIAECQERGGIAAYIDLECSYDSFYAGQIGVNTDELYIVQPNSSEEGLNIMLEMLESGLYDLVILDSVAAISPTGEQEDIIGAQKMGLVARLMSSALRKLVPAAFKSNTAVIMVNQIREKIGGYGNPITTPGGKALGFAASLRLQTSCSTNKATDGSVISNHIKVRVIKSKVGRPFLTSEFDVAFGEGIDKKGEILSKCIEREIIKKGGAWLTYGEVKVQGMEKFKQLMDDNEELYKELKEKIINV